MLPSVPTATDDHIRSTEAARVLGISLATLRRWCDSEANDIPYWRTPAGQRRFSREALRVWIEGRMNR